MTRIRGVLLAVTMVAGVTVGTAVGVATPAGAYCAGFGSPQQIPGAQGRERNQASEPCNANGVYGGQAQDVQVMDDECAYVYYRNDGTTGNGWVQGFGCSTSSWTNYGANGSAFEIRTCVGATGVCGAWRDHHGF